MNYKETTHYKKIHQKVWEVEWENLVSKLRNIIANDIDQKSYTLNCFNRFVEGEATRLYFDDGYHYNQLKTFFTDDEK